MKIVQLIDGKVHWVTDYGSMDDLYAEVPQGSGKTERQRRYPEDCLFVEAPDMVKEGWTCLGDGKFRSDGPERLQEEIDAIDGRLRDMYEESLFQDWVEKQVAKCMPDAADGGGQDALRAAPASVDSGGGDGQLVPEAVYALVKTKNGLERKLKSLEPETVSL